MSASTESGPGPLPGLAALGPVVVYALAIRGVPAVWACAAAAASAGPALVLWGRGPRALILAAVGSAASLAALPIIGARATAAAALAAAAAGALRAPAKASSETAFEPRLMAFGAAGFVVWTRGLSLLSGNAVLSAGLAAAAAFAGLSAAAWWRGGRLQKETAAIIAGTIGLALPHFLRFIGLNSGDPVHLYAPLRCASDAGFLALQPALATAAWALPAGLASAEKQSDRWTLVPLAAAPLAAAALLRWLSPAQAAALINGALIGWAVLLEGSRWLRRQEVRTRLLAAAVAAACVLGLTVGDPFAEIWLNRLNTAYPGGRFLALNDKTPEALGVYQFSTGLRILLRDGIADPNAGLAAWRQTHLALLAHPAPRSVLLVGSRQPAAWDAASRYEAAVDVYDPAPAPQAILDALAGGQWKPPKGVRLASEVGPSYDVIIVYVPVPAHGIEAAALTTREAMDGWRRRLKPGGLLAVRVPMPYFATTRPRIIRAAHEGFKQFGIFDLPGAVLVIASDATLNAGSSALIERLPAGAAKDDAELEKFLAEPTWRFDPKDVDTGAHEDTRDLSRNALPFWEILTTPEPRSDAAVPR